MIVMERSYSAMPSISLLLMLFSPWSPLSC